MARLLLGPLLRHVGETDATIWVETDGPCEVEVLGHTTRTFHVAGHHYAILIVEGLEPRGVTPYEVTLDGDRVWPDPESPFPPSVIRTVTSDHGLKVLFGSCRVAAPHEPPYTLSPDEHEHGFGADALYAFALRMMETPNEEWPHALLLLGDQVYADEVSPQTLDFIRSRRNVEEDPGDEVADFEEYTRLYWEAWGDPVIRWVLSTVSTAMIFDDHDVHDDWNISRQWVERMRKKAWWEDRIAGAFVSYWIYQHLGNLSPRELREDELLARVQGADDAASILRAFALQEDETTDARRWSYCRDFGRTRIITIDCRAGRILVDGHRQMIDDEEWEWLHGRTRGDFDHIILAMSDPFLMARGIHHFQAWNEVVCDGGWGRWFAPIGEKVREGIDLDHWPSFRRAFERLTDLLYEVGAGKRGKAPASIVALAGDVHNAYLAEASFLRGTGVTSRVYQAVCSPIRNPLDAKERRAQRFAATRTAEVVGRLFALAARVPLPRLRWRLVEGPLFENHIATLEFDGRKALMRLERAHRAEVEGENPTLRPIFEHELA